MQKMFFIAGVLMTAALPGVVQGAMTSDKAHYDTNLMSIGQNKEDSVLLGTMHAGIGIGTPKSFDWHWPVLAYDPSVVPGDESVLFEDVVLPPNWPTTISDFSSPMTESDFNEFAAYMTNGVDDPIFFAGWDNQVGLAGGGGGLESAKINAVVPLQGPDLTGYVIDSISRTVTVDMQSPGSDPFGTGVWTDWTVEGDYAIYGRRIPEPGSGIMLLLACAASLYKPR